MGTQYTTIITCLKAMLQDLLTSAPTVYILLNKFSIIYMN